MLKSLLFEIATKLPIKLYELSANEKKKREENLLQEQQRSENMRNYALTCHKCKKLAKPIEGTSNRYRCTCGNQFTGSRHPL
jgi:hypothetical protein